jgi:hypothetical protein
MATTSELKRTALLTLTGASTGTVPELEKTWLVSVTGLPATSTLGELNRSYLNGLGYTTGTNNERWYARIGDAPFSYTGTLRERLYQYWLAGGG